MAERRDEDGKPTGIPDRVTGVAVTNRDAELLRIENSMRDGVAPRIPGLRYRWIDAFEKGPALIIRVPRSWVGPHMVTFQRHWRFYSRHASGKYPLDVFELRDAFLNSGSLSDRVRAFIVERIARIGAGEVHVSLDGERFVCIHVVPHVAISGQYAVDLLKAANHYELVRPFYSQGHSLRFNVDGVISEAVAGAGKSLGYLQLFRNGAIETVSSSLLQSGFNDVPWGLPFGSFAPALFEFIDQSARLFGVLRSRTAFLVVRFPYKCRGRIAAH